MNFNSLINRILNLAADRLFNNLQRPVTIKSRIFQNQAYYKNLLTRSNQDEKWLDQVLSSALNSKQGAFIDVGANTGQTLMKVLSLDDTRRYIGFEPQIECCFYIEQFINSNSLGHCTILPVGLSNKNGLINLLKRSGHADTTASTIEGFRPGDFYSTRQSIAISNGDDVFLNLDVDDISVIKIDVEGGELEVCEGLNKTISNYKPFILFEVLNHYLAVTQQHLDEETIKFRNKRNSMLQNLLHDKGYIIYNVLPGNILKEVDDIQPEISSDLRLTDYIAVPKSSYDNFFNCHEGKLININ